MVARGPAGSLKRRRGWLSQLPERQHVAPPASPGRPPPYELLLESLDGDVQSCPVDPALPLRDTVLCLDLPPGSHLRVDGDRLDTAQSASALGLARGAVLQAFAPQAGGGYEEGDDFEADREAEREMEAEQQHGQPRRRRRVVAESEDDDGATDEGSGEGAPRRRQRVAEESEDDEPIVEEQEGREEQEGAAGGEAMGDARPDRREEGETLVARIMSLGEVHQSLETAATVLSLGSGSTPISERLDPAEMVRAQKAYKWLAKRMHPDKLPGCPDATAAFQVLEQASALWQERFESSRGNAGDEVDRSDGEGGAADEGGAQPAAEQATPANEQQARQAQPAAPTKAQELSERVAKFHQELQRGRVRAPAIAESGMLPWGGVSVEVAQLDESKV